MPKQRTIRSSIQARGVGVHSGNDVTLTLKPAPVDTGLVFRWLGDRVVDIPALARYVGDTRLCTTLVRDGVRVSTVEHLLAAFAGLGLDNMVVELDANELPIMDGSAVLFIFLLQSAGVVEQEAEKRLLRVKRPVRVEEGDRFAEIRPYEGFRLNFAIDYDHPAFTTQNQCVSFDFSSTSFVRHISRARTFGFLSDLDTLRQMNLGQGSSLHNTVVLDDQAVMNSDGLRYPDEFVRHKVLDAIGDLFLLGSAVVGEYHGHKSGHAINNALVQALLAQPDAWEWVSYVDQPCPISFSALSHQLSHRAA